MQNFDSPNIIRYLYFPGQKPAQKMKKIKRWAGSESIIYAACTKKKKLKRKSENKRGVT